MKIANTVRISKVLKWLAFILGVDSFVLALRSSILTPAEMWVVATYEGDILIITKALRGETWIPTVALGLAFLLAPLSVLAQSRTQGRTSDNTSSQGYFYAPTPCELLPAHELAATICATVTVPLAVNFSLRPIASGASSASMGARGVSSRQTKSGIVRGKSNLKGNFTVKVPRGRYRVTVNGAAYHSGNGARSDVAVPLAPRRSVVSFPNRRGQPVAIPLIRVK